MIFRQTAEGRNLKLELFCLSTCRGWCSIRSGCGRSC